MKYAILVMAASAALAGAAKAQETAADQPIDPSATATTHVDPTGATGITRRDPGKPPAAKRVGKAKPTADAHAGHTPPAATSTLNDQAAGGAAPPPGPVVSEETGIPPKAADPQG